MEGSTNWDFGDSKEMKDEMPNVSTEFIESKPFEMRFCMVFHASRTSKLLYYVYVGLYRIIYKK